MDCLLGQKRGRSREVAICVDNQGATKVLSDSPGLVDFAIGLVNFVLNYLPNGQVNYFEEFNFTEEL